MFNHLQEVSRKTNHLNLILDKVGCNLEGLIILLVESDAHFMSKQCYLNTNHPLGRKFRCYSVLYSPRACHTRHPVYFKLQYYLSLALKGSQGLPIGLSFIK